MSEQFQQLIREVDQLAAWLSAHLPLDRLNLKLVLANLDHCRATGLTMAESGERQPMSQIILETVPGT